MRAAALLLVGHLAVAASAALPSFEPPVANMYAANADLVTRMYAANAQGLPLSLCLVPSLYAAITVASAEECAARCLAYGPDCVSFNLCGLDCGISGWNISYVPAGTDSCMWYRRMIPRDDSPIKQAVPWLLAVPTAGVSIVGGPLLNAFEGNLYGPLWE